MKQKLNKCLLTWGLYPMLITLKHYEEKEMHEECYLIKQAIDEVFKEKTPSVESTITHLKETIPNAIKNMWYYEQECLKEVSQILTLH